MPHVVTHVGQFRGVMLGTAVGDALGLPAEGLSRARIHRWYRGSWRHRLVFGRGMVSDDTEHTLFVAQSLLSHPESADGFARRLAWSLRGWLLTLPAGVGLGTLRAILKLWVGFPASRSGVQSAGNGPAMRIAPVGAFFADAPEKLDDYVSAATRLTHRDERARIAASAVARLVAWVFAEELYERPSRERFVARLRGAGLSDPEWCERVDQVDRAAERDATVPELAEELGLERGVTGYAYDTVPVAAYAWFRHFGDYRATLTSVLDCGGDTDTTGAIVGAMAGAVVGEKGIPDEWIQGLLEWPRGCKLLREVADRLAAASEGDDRRPARYFWPAVLPRNALFLLIVLLHGFRRLAPPYARRSS